MLNETDFGLLRALVAFQSPSTPWNVEELSRKLGVSPAFVSQRLRRLERQSLVKRRQEASKDGRVVFYLPKPFCAVRWISPGEGVALGWKVEGEMEWSFPLISQIPDEAARHTLLKLLQTLREKSLLDPWHKKSAVWKNVSELFRGLTIILYGSTARSEARPGADVDLLFVHDDPKSDHAQNAADIADEVSLHSPRPMQVKHLNFQQLSDLPERMLSALRKDALIVYDGLWTKPGGETRGIWKLVYGGRLHDRG